MYGPYPLPDKSTYQRREFAAWLHKQWQPVPVLACGGRTGEGEQPLPVAMRDLLERAGVPENMISIETDSRSTHENAVYGAAILRKHGVSTIALVVEARDMLRASASFRKQGIAMVLVPCAYRQFRIIA